MTNVIPFQKPEPAPVGYIVTTLVIDTHTPLSPGDMVAWQLQNPKDGEWWQPTRWMGPTGRGKRGRFVRKGSPEEVYGGHDALAEGSIDLAAGFRRLFVTSSTDANASVSDEPDEPPTVTLTLRQLLNGGL